ncbi:amidohydrolase [Nocardia brasiliensis]
MAELLFVGGAVYLGGGVITSDPVAVCDGRIRLGSAARANDVVDLRGRMLLPGFQDAHIHAVFGGIELGQCHLGAARTIDDCRALVAEYAVTYPEREWIVGSGWCAELAAECPSAAEFFDAIVPHRPVYLLSRDRRRAWVNSKALESAGIDRWTPDPPNGRIERRGDGALTGNLTAGAIGLVSEMVPELTEAEQLAGLLRAQRLLHEVGVVGWQDALLGPRDGLPDPGEIYLLAAAAGTLTARVSGAMSWEIARGSEQIGELLARRERLHRGRLQARSVKIPGDFVAQHRTAATAALTQVVTMLDACDFQVHFEAPDGGAVRECLAALEAAWKINGDRGNRHHLAQQGVVDPDDIERLAAVGAVAGLRYPDAGLSDSGVLVAAGSDWPVHDADPLRGIQAAVRRFAPRGLGLAAALDAYTAGSSYVNHAEGTGRIADGCYADLVVLDRNPFDYPAEDIGNARVDMTLVEGRIVYMADGC